MKKTAGRYHGEAGIERVDHDGVTHVVEPKDIEVSQKERLGYYENGKPGDDQRLLHKRKNMETSYDDGGNPMWVNEEHRTSNPRPHQYSLERRMQEQREPGSTYDITSDASKEQALAQAFVSISAIVIANGVVENKKVIAISDKSGIPIEEVFSLCRIAERDQNLAKKYASIPGVEEDSCFLEKTSDPAGDGAGCGCQKGKKCKCQKGKCNCDKKTDKEVLTEDELKQIGLESGLCE